MRMRWQCVAKWPSQCSLSATNLQRWLLICSTTSNRKEGRPVLRQPRHTVPKWIGACLLSLLVMTVSFMYPTSTAHAQGLSPHAQVVGSVARMVVVCTGNTPAVQTYLVKHRLCTSSKGTSPDNTVGGNCGLSWIYGTNQGGGQVRWSIGGTSILGGIVWVAPTVKWFGGANGNGRYSTSYPWFNNPLWALPVYANSGRGRVEGDLSGFVILWFGGTCNILNPVSIIYVT